MIASDFIVKYVPFGYSGRQIHYKLSDNFCWFWLTFVEGYSAKDDCYWSHKVNKPEYNSWKGIAFEEVCFNHSKQIKNALGIGGVSSTESAYIVKNSDDSYGMRLDMVIERADNVVNICEMKFSSGEYVIQKSEDLKIRNRIEAYREETKTRCAVLPVLVTTYGLQKNMYSDNIRNVITMDDLFK